MANDFSGDVDCVAVWNFESGALGTDSKGNNDMTNHGVTDGATCKQGSCSGDFETSESDYMECTDANLDAGFPFKNGDTNKKISVCFWFKMEAASSASKVIFAKYASTGDKRSYLIGLTISEEIYFNIGYNNGASFETITHGSVLVAGRWYHIGATFQDSDKSYFLKIWDDFNSCQLGTNLDSNSTNNINVEDAYLYFGIFLGWASYLDGLVDELVVFKDILLEAEIDAVRAGIYTVAVAAAPTSALYGPLFGPLGGPV